MADSKPNLNADDSNNLQGDFLLSEEKHNSNNMDTDEFACGLGSWKPQWLQRMANAKVYLLVFCLLGILQGAYFSYLVGVMSTLEKRFAFESKVSGLIMIADNITPILLSVLIGYYGSQAHRPRMVGFGMLVVVLSCYMCAIPYFLYGPATHLLSTGNLTVTNTSKYEYCDGEEKDICTSGKKGSTNAVAVTIFFIASALEGIGSAAFYTVGASYLDDNIKKKQSPMYFSTMFALRMLGPSLGYLLSSLSLKYFEDPLYDPEIGRTDPRWIGAWWIGFLILGTALLIFSIPMFMFPRHLKPTASKQETAEKKTSTDLPPLRDMPRALARLGRNPILMCHTFSIIFRVFGYLGYYLFLPKYMETQFRQSASTANFYTGSTSLITQIIGVLLGGIIVRRLKPRPRFLIAYMMVVEFFTLFAMLSNLFVGCPPIQMSGVNEEFGRTTMLNECNSECGCSTKVFAPVCGTDGSTTYFTPCFAGCRSPFTEINGTKVLEGCSCVIPERGRNHIVQELTTDGYCPMDCGMFVVYIALISVSKTIASTSRIISTLLTLRCIDPSDKSLTLGALDAILSIFAFIPAPLVFGALTDSACLVWEKSCGETGNCWFYDSTKFRHYIHGAAFSFIAVGTLFDLGIFFMSGRLKNFYEDEEQPAIPITQLCSENDGRIMLCSEKKCNNVHEKPADESENSMTN